MINDIINRIGEFLVTRGEISAEEFLIGAGVAFVIIVLAAWRVVNRKY